MTAGTDTDKVAEVRQEMGRYARALSTSRVLTGRGVAERVGAWLATALPDSGLDVAETLDPTCEDESGEDGVFACSRCGATGAYRAGEPIAHCPHCGARVVRRGREDLLDQGTEQGMALATNACGTTVWRWRRRLTAGGRAEYVAEVAVLGGIDDLGVAESVAPGVTQADIIWTIGEYETRDEAIAAARAPFERGRELEDD